VHSDITTHLAAARTSEVWRAARDGDATRLQPARRREGREGRAAGLRRAAERLRHPRFA
jgi:hypothetical protein